MEDHDLEKAQATSTGATLGVSPGMNASFIAISAEAGAAVAGGQSRNTPYKIEADTAALTDRVWGEDSNVWTDAQSLEVVRISQALAKSCIGSME